MAERGTYGEPSGRGSYVSGGGWGWKAALVIGLGVTIYMLLPSIGPKPPKQFPSQPPPPPDDLDELARSKGFASTRAYEDAVLASAQELKREGAKVTLGCHLSHLEPRLHEGG